MRLGFGARQLERGLPLADLHECAHGSTAREGTWLRTQLGHGAPQFERGLLLAARLARVHGSAAI
eukprot:15153192-Alexandrium_andersonii.AAC.1